MYIVDKIFLAQITFLSQLLLGPILFKIYFFFSLSRSKTDVVPILSYCPIPGQMSPYIFPLNHSSLSPLFPSSAVYEPYSLLCSIAMCSVLLRMTTQEFCRFYSFSHLYTYPTYYREVCLTNEILFISSTTLL